MYRKIRRHILMKMVFLILIIIVCSVCYLIYMNRYEDDVKDGEVIIIEDKSFLNDFEVIGNEVHIYCTISLENNSSNSKEVKLIGNFKKEVDKGLLKESTLKAHFIEDDADTIIINGNSNIKYVKIEFVGEYSGNSSMNNKKLPLIEVVEITEE